MWREKMKHTNFYDQYRTISRQERRELTAAVKAHGGEYVFIPEDSEDWDEGNNVIIKASSQYYDEDNKDRYVSRVTVDKYGELHIYGFDTEYDSPSDEHELFNIEYGHLEYILDAIPETNYVRDVSKTLSKDKKPVLVFSREDVEVVGYDSNMTNDQFLSLALAVSKAYEFNMDMYWDALRQACEDVNLTPLNK